MSYRKKHIKNKIYKIKPKKSIFSRLWFWLLILFLIIASTAIYFSLFYSGIQIKNVLVSGNEKVNSQELQQLVFDNAKTGLINLGFIKVNSNSIFLVNLKKIEKNILEKFPGIESANADKKLFETLVIKISERSPVAVFCSEDIGEEECFLLDKDGVAFEAANQNSVSTIVRQDLGGKHLFVGEEIINKNIMNSIVKIKKDLKDKLGVDLEEAFITSPVRLNIKTSENWKVYFDLSGNGAEVDSQITKLNLIFEKEITQENRPNLRYIDLRPKDRGIICDNSTCGG